MDWRLRFDKLTVLSGSALPFGLELRAERLTTLSQSKCNVEGQPAG